MKVLVHAFCTSFQITHSRQFVMLCSVSPMQNAITAKLKKRNLLSRLQVTKFHRMIFGRSFTLQVDHKPLTFNSKKEIPTHIANRLQRWALQLLSYDFKIEYVKTSEFGHVNALSRLINNQLRSEEDYVIASVQMETDLTFILNDSLQISPITSK